MGFVVTKPFNTHLQRFAVGAPVSPDDHLSPFDFSQLRDRGWIAEPPSEAPVANPTGTEPPAPRPRRGS